MADGERPASRRRRRVGGDGEPTVFCADEQDDLPVDLDRWQRLATDVLLAEGVRGLVEMSLIFVNEDEIAALNLEHMQKAGPTDVLSFPIDMVADADEAVDEQAARRGPDRPPPDLGDIPLLLGDIVVCPAVTARQAPDHAGNVDDELALLVVHGVLHILGHDHHDPEETAVMRTKELAHLEAHHWGGPAPEGFRQVHADEQGDSQ